MAIFNGTRAERDSSGSLPTINGKRGMFSVIGPDVVITGNIVATADLHIDGRVDGDVLCNTLVQGPDSHIDGAVRAETARLAGSITGSVSVRQLTVERAARVTGDVDYETITIETGAAIDGRLKHISADSNPHAFDRSAPVVAPENEAIVQFTTETVA